MALRVPESLRSQNNGLGVPASVEPSTLESLASGATSTFGSVLDWIGSLGAGVRSGLAGNFEGAARNIGDFFLDPIDAFLPGDVIPELARPEDDISGSELFKKWGILPEYAGGASEFLIDTGVGILTDPITFLSGGGSAAAKTAAQSAGKAALAARAAQGAMEAVPSLAKGARVSGQLIGKTAQAAPGFSDELAKLAAQADELQAAYRATQPFAFAGKSFGPTAGTIDDALAATRSGIGSAAEKIVGKRIKEGVADWGTQALKATKNAMGWANPGRYLAGRRSAAQSAAGQAAELSLKEVDGIYAGLSKADDEAAFWAMQGVVPENGTYRMLQGAGPEQWAEDAARVLGADAAKVSKAVKGQQALNETQWRDWVKFGVVEAPVAKATNKAYTSTAENLGKTNYLPRFFRGESIDDVGDITKHYGGIGGDVGGAGTATKSRVLETRDDLLNFLNDPNLPDLAITRASQAAKLRAQQQGAAIGKAQMVRDLIDKDLVLTKDSAVIGRYLDKIKNNDRELFDTLNSVIKGNAPRNWFTKLLSKGNKIFKKAAVSGILIPRFSAIVRNQVGGVWQELSTSGLRGAARQAKDAPRNLFGAITDGLNKVGIGQRHGSYAKQLKILDEASEFSRGSLDAFRKYVANRDPMLAEAIEAGVLDAFVSTEEITRQLGKAGNLKKFLSNAMDMPATMFQGLESRMRLGAFLDARNAGKSVDEAAGLVRDTFLDYSVTGSANRTMRDIIPFLAFTAQSIPQQLKFLAQNPRYAVALSEMYETDKEMPLLPWLQGQPSITTDMKDAEGNPLVLAGLGLPVEVLDMIPGSINPRELGKQLRQDWVGSAHPLLKAAYGYTTGRDPFFDSPYATYDKTPYWLQAMGAPERSEAGRIINEIQSTGLTQPLTSGLGQINKALDPRMSLGQKALNLLTGARLVSNDPLRAEQQNIESMLSTDPQALGGNFYYTRAPEEDLTARAIKRLAEIKREQKRKQKEEAAKVQ